MPEAFENYFIVHEPANKNIVNFVNNLNEYLNDQSLSVMDTFDAPFVSQPDISLSTPYLDEQPRYIGEPKLNILVQPTDKFRFRYKSEMIGTHGSLGGDGKSRRSLPKVKLENYNDGPAYIRCTLFTANENDRRPHAHRLVRKEGNDDYDDPHDIEVSPENNYTAVFQGMGIIHTARKNLKDELIRKKKLALALANGHKDISCIKLTTRDKIGIEMDADVAQKTMNLNTVALCFQAFRIKDKRLEPITAQVFSNPINNLKSALTGELKICKISRFCGSCEGNDEVFMLVEKVGKKNIKIKFFEVNEDDKEIWYNYGNFNELDVHHQYAIVFNTPPYKDMNITERKTVYMKLERPSDGESSNTLQFIYLPSKRSSFMEKKRRRLSISSYDFSTDFVKKPSDIINENSSDFMDVIKSMNSGFEESNYFSDTLSDFELSDMFREYQQLQSDGIPKSSTELFSNDLMERIVQLLKANPSDVHVQLKKLLMEKTKYGDTLLHSTLRNDCFDDVSRILKMLSRIPKHSAEIINLTNIVEVTPLHLAVLKGRAEIVQSLIVLGANVMARDMQGRTPLDYVLDHEETYTIKECIDILLPKYKSDYDLSSLLITAAKNGLYIVLVTLIEAGVDVNAIDSTNGKTALHLAIEGQHDKIIIYLLTKTNIDVNKKSFSGYTALHYAMTSDWSWKNKLCQLLKEHGADPLPSNSDEEDNLSNEIKFEIESESENEETIEEDKDNNSEQGKSSLNSTKEQPNARQLLEDSFENCKIKDETPEMDEEAIMQLSFILDKTRGWVKLAEKTGLHYLIKLLNDSKESSPSLRVINYAMENHFTPNKILVILKEIGEKDAANKLSDILLSN